MTSAHISRPLCHSRRQVGAAVTAAMAAELSSPLPPSPLPLPLLATQENPLYASFGTEKGIHGFKFPPSSWSVLNMLVQWSNWNSQMNFLLLKHGNGATVVNEDQQGEDMQHHCHHCVSPLSSPDDSSCYPPPLQYPLPSTSDGDPASRYFSSRLYNVIFLLLFFLVCCSVMD